MDSANRPLDLYAPIEPYETGMMGLDSGHQMYWEQSGNPQGIPVVFLHGGPGAGASTSHRRFFDPGRYRIIIFDQRGAGRSRPYASIEDNTTQHLIGDLERLRQFLGVDRWLLFGGSWGSTLALAYGIQHPEHCLGFILRGVFLGRQTELDWFLCGMRTIFPEAWREFSDFAGETSGEGLIAVYARRLADPDPSVHGPAARAWCRYESACSVLRPADSGGGDPASLSMARMEVHYFQNGMFLPDDFAFAGMDALSNLPAVIVQGRYDIICPITTADELAGAWSGADYVVVPDAGHSAMEPGIRRALVGAAERFKTGTFI